MPRVAESVETATAKAIVTSALVLRNHFVQHTMRLKYRV